MGEEWSKLVWIAVDVIMTGFIIMTASVYLSMASQLGRVQQRESDAVAVAKEYRTYNRFNGTELYSQDVISTVMEFKGFPEIWVDTLVGPGENWTLKWDTSYPANDVVWTLDWLSSAIPTVATYQSSLHKNLNGEIDRIEFRRD